MHILDNKKAIEQIDQTRMRDILGGFAGYCKQAYRLGETFSLSKDFRRLKNIVFSGMGGSAIGAEIITYFLRAESKVSMYVNTKNYIQKRKKYSLHYYLQFSFLLPCWWLYDIPKLLS